MDTCIFFFFYGGVGVVTSSCSNQAAQLQRLARILNFACLGIILPREQITMTLIRLRRCRVKAGLWIKECVIKTNLISQWKHMLWILKRTGSAVAQW